MGKETGSVVFLGAVAGLLLASAVPASARELPAAGSFNPVLVANGTSFCGPCEPAPVILHAQPDSAVVALRYRYSAAWGSFELVAKDQVGATDHQGELRFTLPQGERSLDKVVVVVGDVVSNGILFLTNGGCTGPQLCPLPFRLHAFANASAYLAGAAVVTTVTGAAPGSVLEIAQERYVEEGDYPQWIPTGRPVVAEADALGRATVTLEGAGPGVFRAIARDRETGEESSFALYEVLEGVR
jgi:hypothetical protein